MSPIITFALDVSLGYGSENDSLGALNKACASNSSSPISLFGTNSSSWLFGSNSNNDMFVASATALEMSVDQDKSASQRHHSSLVAIFVPPAIIDSCLGKATANNKVHALGSCFFINEPQRSKLAADLLPRIHAKFENCTLRGIILTSIAEQNAPAEIVLLDVSQRRELFSDMMNATNGQSIVDDPDAIIKILPVSKITFLTEERSEETLRSRSTQKYFLPTCPVCLHRIDPVRLGLAKPPNQHLCSKFCPSPSLISGSFVSESAESCQKQRFLRQWPHPARCTACNVIHQYWNRLSSHDESNDLFCAECAMHQTLWVCLTCGFVGCGRYSNKHSVAHFREAGHPYSLELATLRIWDYTDGEHGGYAHRIDLLDCPSSPPLAQPWMTRSRAGGLVAASSHVADVVHSKTDSFDSVNAASAHDPQKSPKKATMIGEEYEALLQSALEDQAQHYEGEITRLRADLTAALVDEGSMTIEELREIEDLKSDINRLRKDIDQAGRELLDAQAQEAGHRATSQRLLREQQVANDVLTKIQEEAKREHELGKLQVEDLEQQIADLTGNLRMRQQFSESEELNNAQIFGTKSSDTKTGKRGKKQRRFFRK